MGEKSYYNYNNAFLNTFSAAGKSVACPARAMKKEKIVRVFKTVSLLYAGKKEKAARFYPAALYSFNTGTARLISSCNSILIAYLYFRFTKGSTTVNMIFLTRLSHIVYYRYFY